jgi:hypothetical protein
MLSPFCKDFLVMHAEAGLLAVCHQISSRVEPALHLNLQQCFTEVFSYWEHTENKFSR